MADLNITHTKSMLPKSPLAPVVSHSVVLALEELAVPLSVNRDKSLIVSMSLSQGYNTRLIADGDDWPLPLWVGLKLSAGNSGTSCCRVHKSWLSTCLAPYCHHMHS